MMSGSVVVVGGAIVEVELGDLIGLHLYLEKVGGRRILIGYIGLARRHEPPVVAGLEQRRRGLEIG